VVAAPQSGGRVALGAPPRNALVASLLPVTTPVLPLAKPAHQVLADLWLALRSKRQPAAGADLASNAAPNGGNAAKPGLLLSPNSRRLTRRRRTIALLGATSPSSRSNWRRGDHARHRLRRDPRAPDWRRVRRQAAAALHRQRPFRTRSRERGNRRIGARSARRPTARTALGVAASVRKRPRGRYRQRFLRRLLGVESGSVDVCGHGAQGFRNCVDAVASRARVRLLHRPRR
jgi:hypothetical protein